MKPIETQITISRITGMINNHIRYCNIEDCTCRMLGLDEKDVDSQTNHIDTLEYGKMAKGIQETCLQAKHEELNTKLCEVLNFTLKNINQTKENGEREIIRSYVDYFMLNRIFNSLHDIMLAEEYPLSLFQQLQIFCLKLV